jgi:hypothetical protein
VPPDDFIVQRSQRDRGKKNGNENVFHGYCDRRTTTPPFMTNDTFRVAEMSAAGPRDSDEICQQTRRNAADLCFHFHHARVD